MMGAAGAMIGPALATTGAIGAEYPTGPAARGAGAMAGPTRPGPESTAAWKAAPLAAKWSALAATTAGSSAGVTAPLGWATNCGTPARGPTYGRGPAMMGAAGAMIGPALATTGAIGAEYPTGPAAIGAGATAGPTRPGPESTAAWKAAPLAA